MNDDLIEEITSAISRSAAFTRVFLDDAAARGDQDAAEALADVLEALTNAAQARAKAIRFRVRGSTQHARRYETMSDDSLTYAEEQLYDLLND